MFGVRPDCLNILVLFLFFCSEGLVRHMEAVHPEAKVKLSSYVNDRAESYTQKRSRKRKTRYSSRKLTKHYQAQSSARKNMKKPANNRYVIKTMLSKKRPSKKTESGDTAGKGEIEFSVAQSSSRNDKQNVPTYRDVIKTMLSYEGRSEDAEPVQQNNPESSDNDEVEVPFPPQDEEDIDGKDGVVSVGKNGQKEFRCKTCSRSCQSRAHLKRHMLIHTDQQACSLCWKVYKNMMGKFCLSFIGLFHWISIHPLWKIYPKLSTEGVLFSNG